ncbi:MAG: tetratricopeptide repeat protein [Casimicrobiaceae bacterium]
MYWTRLLLAAFAMVISGMASAFDECGSLENGYGPFDYRTSKQELAIVDTHHFNSDVEQLRRGISGPIGGELDYTLRAAPNHHRALMAMVNLALKVGNEKPQGANYTVSCYFDRAMRFAADDGTVRMIHGIYLSKVGKKREALKRFEEARSLSKENANIHYNLGLLYFDLKDYDNALLNAQKAYQLGFELPGLKNKLVGAGRWRDPGPVDKAPRPAE